MTHVRPINAAQPDRESLREADVQGLNQPSLWCGSFGGIPVCWGGGYVPHGEEDPFDCCAKHGSGPIPCAEDSCAAAHGYGCDEVACSCWMGFSE